MGDTGGRCQQMHPNYHSPVIVRTVCALGVLTCGWALFNLSRCSRSLQPVVCIIVAHALILHVLEASFAIAGVSLAAQEDTVANEGAGNNCVYLLLTSLAWQEHMAYLLLVVAYVSRSIRIDHALLYIVVTWAAAETPPMGMVLPYFADHRNYSSADSCRPSLWRPDNDLINRESVFVPSVTALGMMLIAMMYRVRWPAPSLLTGATCQRCSACAENLAKVIGFRLMRRLIVAFLLLALPRVLFWIVAMSPGTDTRDYEWVVLSAQGMGAWLAGILTLLTQCQVLYSKILPFYAPTSTINGVTDSGDLQHNIHGVHDETDQMSSPVVRETGLLRECNCSHCADHRRTSTQVSADRMAETAGV